MNYVLLKDRGNHLFLKMVNEKIVEIIKGVLVTREERCDNTVCFDWLMSFFTSAC